MRAPARAALVVDRDHREKAAVDVPHCLAADILRNTLMPTSMELVPV